MKVEFLSILRYAYIARHYNSIIEENVQFFSKKFIGLINLLIHWDHKKTQTVHGSSKDKRLSVTVSGYSLCFLGFFY